MGKKLVVPYRSEGTKPPIFSQGGSTHLGDYLGEDQPVYWLEVYGGDGTRVPGSIQEEASAYLEEIRQIQPQGPYHLMGYCFGALVVYEIAQQLKQQGEEVSLLVLISPAIPSFRGSTAEIPVQPKALSADADRRDASRLTVGKLSQEIKRIAGKVPRRWRWAKRISKRLVCELWLRRGRPLPVSLRDFYLNQRGDELIARYVPEPYSSPVMLFRSLADGSEGQWRDVIANVEFHNSWVDHNEFLEEPYVKVIATEVKDFLKRIELRSYAPAAQSPAAHGQGSKPPPSTF
jgi:thioesterase domain-containing protein